MTRRYFGTDGIRGQANTEPMTAEIAMRVAQAAGAYFKNGKKRHTAVIGKDTRLSGYLLEPALTAGFISAGMDVVLLGPLPTPAVAMLTRTLRADIGVMISASHNPYLDNGIKLFGPDGFKLSDEVELAIEDMMDKDPAAYRVPSDQLGRARRLDDEQGRYIEFAKASFPRGLRLDGLKIAVDCAHGAAYKVAPSVLWELGAEVIAIGVEPNGLNINESCGATHPEVLATQVVTHGADIGIALDGDADRLIVVDENGKVIDGDQLLSLIALSWQAEGRLNNDTVVATVMSNLGMEKFLTSRGIKMIRTPVGDRYVLEEMLKHNHNVGGEQSGHLVLRDYSNTGDGLVAALQVLAVLQQSGQTASECLSVFEPWPQLKENIRFTDKNPLEDKKIQAFLDQQQKDLGADGRVLVRKSGTEPLIRVMVEGESFDLINTTMTNIVSELKKAV